MRRKFDTYRIKSSGQDCLKEILIDEEEIIGQLINAGNEKKFLGIFTEKEIYTVLRKYKVISSLHEQGFKNTYIQIVTEDSFNHTLRICHDGIAGEILLVELVIQQTSIPPGNLFKDFTDGQKLEMLFVDWLLLQNPTKKAGKNDLLLPGQRFPGLGLAREMWSQILRYFVPHNDRKRAFCRCL